MCEITTSIRIWVKIIVLALIITNSNSNGQLSNSDNDKDRLGLGGLDDILPQTNKVYTLKEFGPKAKIDANSITISGFSSGGYMSMQFHVAYSSIIKGAGILSGGPYARNYGTQSGTLVGGFNFLTTVLIPTLTAKSTPKLLAQAQEFEAQGHIDPLKNLKGSKAFIFHGMIDPVVRYTEGIQVKELYEAFGANAKMKILDRCSHGIPTKYNGGPCGLVNIQQDWVNKCGYQGIFEMFRHLYHDFHEPSTSLPTKPLPLGSKYYTFDQTPFIPANYSTSRGFMAPTGFIYIPRGCQKAGQTCRLHLALHGCAQSIYTEYGILGNPFALETGYTQVADANNMVVIFPQFAPHYIDIKKSNVLCWDAFRGTTKGFPYKTAPEMQALYNILADMIGLVKIK